MVLLPVNLFSDYGGINKLRRVNRQEAEIKQTDPVMPYSNIHGRRVEQRIVKTDRRRHDRRHEKYSILLNTRDVHERRNLDRRHDALHEALTHAENRPQPVSSSSVLRRATGLDVYV